MKRYCRFCAEVYGLDTEFYSWWGIIKHTWQHVFPRAPRCEGCDKKLKDSEGRLTEDSVRLCDECFEDCANDLSCHTEECECGACEAGLQKGEQG